MFPELSDLVLLKLSLSRSLAGLNKALPCSSIQILSMSPVCYLSFLLL
jgi:hypothetical protein